MTYNDKLEMLNFEYLKNLNEAQKEAVLYLDGPLLIVAGAGSGKTKVLTSRIAHIIKERKGIFVSKRTIDSFCETTKHVMQNYNKIQKSIEENKFPLKEDMLKQISDIIS